MKKIILAIPVLLCPTWVYAQGLSSNDVSGLFEFFDNLIGALVPLMVALAIMYFLWGVLKFVASGADEEKRVAGRYMMVHGVIAIFVMVSVWGLVALIDNTFDLDDTPAEEIPLPIVDIP